MTVQPVGIPQPLTMNPNEVAAPADAHGYAFANPDVARLGPPRRPRYRLAYTIATEDVPIGTTPSQETTRYNVIGRIDWALTEIAGGTTLISDGFESFASYADTGTPVSGLAAAEDAHRRLMVLMADHVVDKLTATAGIWRNGGAVAPVAVAPVAALPAVPEVLAQPLP